jgi:glycosyltransferase involved in cell wall biosynthesis
MHGLARALRERGHDAHVITIDRGWADADDVPVRRLDLPLFVNDHVARPGPRLIHTLYDLLEQQRVDVVHAHGMFSSLAHAAVACADALGIPSVMTHHSLMPPHVRPWARLVYAGMSHRTDVITAVSMAAAADVRRVSGRSDVAVLPNGIELNGWHPTVGPLGANSEVRVLSVMRLTRTKSPLDLLEAVPRVLARVANPSHVRFTIVGDGPERKRMERRAASLGVTDRVEFMG